MGSRGSWSRTRPSPQQLPDAARRSSPRSLREHLDGNQTQVIEVGDVEDLEVEAIHAGGGETAELVEHLGRSACETAAAQLVDVAADRYGAPRDLGIGPAT